MTIEQARTLYQQNRLDDAQAVCLRLLEHAPGNCNVLTLLGAVHLKRHGVADAETCFRRVVAIQPESGPGHLNLGHALVAQERYQDALTEYEAAARLDPRSAETHCALGQIHLRLARIDRAVENFNRALHLNPGFSEAHYYLGALRLQQRHYDHAVTHFKEAILRNPADTTLGAVKAQGLQLAGQNQAREALSLFLFLSTYMPTDVEIWNILATLHLSVGQTAEATECSRRILALDPNNDGAEVNLGHVEHTLGRTKDALEHYRRALAINPLNVSALMYFGTSCRTWPDIEYFLASYRNALETDPDPANLRPLFVEVAERIRPERYDPWLDEELQRCFDLDDISYRRLTRVSTDLLRQKYRSLFNADPAMDPLDVTATLAGDRLLIRLLESDINVDAALERVLTRVRRALLRKYRRAGRADTAELPLMIALAHQGHNNEHVFHRDEEEAGWIAELRRDIDARLRDGATPTRALEDQLVAYAMYERLFDLACRGQLGAVPLAAWSTAVRGLVEDALLNPLLEEQLKQEIPSIGEIGNETSRLVRSQYEENPYPRWRSLTVKRDQDFRQVIGREFPNLSVPRFLDGPLKVLIAGCGTGKHPIQTALAYPNSEILAVDISKSSLAYAARMARRYDARNVRFIHCDILELRRLNERFHIVESIGVIHHMKDPMAGWRVLADLVADDGLLSIALYSEKARRDVVAARELIQKLGLDAAPGDIRKFRQRLLNQDSDELLNGLTQSPDFYTTSACRDLLFHFMEHRFTISKIRHAIEELQLTFLGFTFSDFRIKASYRSLFPKDTAMNDFDNWDRYETRYPDTFRNMYHFWCQK